MIDYHSESDKYRPTEILTLLVGEAPPPNGKTYFYVPRNLNTKAPLESDRNLPATIFGHYFNRRPSTVAEYVTFLEELRNRGVFLVDICDINIKVRGSKSGEAQVVDSLSTLRDRLSRRGIAVADDRITFLLARTSYLKHIKGEFPRSRYVSWIDFRVNRVTP